VICFLASINLELCNHVVRIEPITAIYGEWSDTKFLDALFEPAQKPKPLEDAFSIADLPLDHYVFLGEARVETRNRVLAAFVVRYPDAQILDASDSGFKDKFIAMIAERKSGMIDSLIPLFILASKFEQNYLTITKIGVYFLVESVIDTPINSKIVDGDTAKKIDSNAKVTLGYYDQRKGIIKQLKG
jgi:hypothetical protein